MNGNVFALLLATVGLLSAAAPTFASGDGKAGHELTDGRRVFLKGNVVMIVPTERGAEPVAATTGKYRLKGGGVIEVGARGIIIVGTKPVDPAAGSLVIVDELGIVAVHLLTDGRRVLLDDNVLRIAPELPGQKPVAATEGKYHLQGGGVIEVGADGVVMIGGKAVPHGTKGLSIIDSKGIIIVDI